SVLGTPAPHPAAAPPALSPAGRGPGARLFPPCLRAFVPFDEDPLPASPICDGGGEGADPLPASPICDGEGKEEDPPPAPSRKREGVQRRRPIPSSPSALSPLREHAEPR